MVYTINSTIYIRMLLQTFSILIVTIYVGTIYKEISSHVSWMRPTVRLVTPKAFSYWNNKHYCSKSKEMLIQANLKKMFMPQQVATHPSICTSDKQQVWNNVHGEIIRNMTLAICLGSTDVPVMDRAQHPGTTDRSIVQGTSLMNRQTHSILPTSVNCATSPQCQTPPRAFITTDTQRQSGQDGRSGWLL